MEGCMRKIGLLLIVGCLLVSSVVFIGCREEYRQEFSYETFIVILTEEATERLVESNFDFSIFDFSEISVYEVRRISPYGMPDHLVITISDPSRKNILNAIEVISLRSEVYMAVRNWFTSIM